MALGGLFVYIMPSIKWSAQRAEIASILLPLWLIPGRAKVWAQSSNYRINLPTRYADGYTHITGLPSTAHSVGLPEFILHVDEAQYRFGAHETISLDFLASPGALAQE